MRARRTRGFAAIEFALVIGVWVVILVNGLYFGRMAMAGVVLDRAANDAARYLATVPVERLRDSAQRALALANAQAMTQAALADAGIAAQDLQLDFRCGLSSCGVVSAANPLASMTVTAMLRYHDDWFGAVGDVDLLSYAEAGRGN